MLQDVHHTGGTPRGQMNQPRRSMQHQYSLISQRSLRSHRSVRSQISRRSGTQVPEPPSKAADDKEAKEVRSAGSAAQAASAKEEGRAPEQDVGSASSNGFLASSEAKPDENPAGQGTPLSQVAKSAFEGWNAEGQHGGSAKQDQVHADVTKSQQQWQTSI